jgi:hypothetical protein
MMAVRAHRHTQDPAGSGLPAEGRPRPQAGDPLARSIAWAPNEIRYQIIP